MRELSKNLMCIKIGEVEIWTEVDKIKELISVLKNRNGQQFIQIGDEVVNRSFITGIFTPQTMEDVTRRKNGMWRCRYGYWHERGEKCAHGELKKYDSKRT